MLNSDSDLRALSQELVESFGDVNSTEEYEAHPLRKKLKPELDKLFSSFEVFEPSLKSKAQRKPMQFTAWNIERGLAFDGIKQSLSSHPDMSSSSAFLLTEVDYGMARSGNRHIAKELADSLGLYGVYAPAYFNLDLGNGAEQQTGGKNTFGLQGHAILSSHPIRNVRLAHLPNAKDHLKGNERQLGQEVAIIADLETPEGPVSVSSIHLAAHSSRKHRVKQMQSIMSAFSENEDTPALVGGDWNTTTYNAHKALPAIIGFWVRVAMGVNYMIEQHYPYPERFFEKELFTLLQDHNFKIKPFNVHGGCTLHYDFNDPFVRKSLEDWLPKWCFKCIDWSLRKQNGLCSFKLDWFAGRHLCGREQHIVRDLPSGEHRYSDHDPHYYHCKNIGPLTDDRELRMSEVHDT